VTEATRVFERIVRGRRSVRAFLPREVDRETLEAVFSVAQCAPSNCNTQPWLVHVASGATLDALRDNLPQRYQEGALCLDVPYNGQYPGVYRERQHAAAQALYASCGVVREDKAGRNALFLRNFGFFGAPHAAFLFLPEGMGLREAADLGMYAQTLMLAMGAHGLGSCPQTSVSFFADAIREALGVAPGPQLLFGIAFGYEDAAAPINNCRTERAALDETVVFHQ